MKKAAWRSIRLWLIALILAGAPWTAARLHAGFAEPGIKPASITVVCDDDYPPYAFRGGDGLLQGIVVDHWRAWERVTGIRVELKGMDWGDALAAMRAGEADAIDTIFRNDERETWLDFSPPYARLDVPVFFHTDISGIASPQDLRGFRVAVKEGDACVEVLRSFGVLDLEFYSSYDAIVAAAVAGLERVFCIDEAPALYLLSKARASASFKKALKLYTGFFHRAVKAGNGALLKILNDGFALVGEAEKAGINRRWFGSALGGYADPKLLWILGIAAVVGAMVAGNMTIAANYLRKRVAARTAELADKVRQLTASETRHHAIVDALPDLLFVFDRDARFIEFQASATSALAMPPEAFLGRTVSEAFGDADLHSRTVEAIARAMSGTGVQSVLYRLSLGAAMVRFEARIVGMGADRALCVARDVTEREAAAETLESSLREKEALLKEIHHRVKNNLQIVSSLLSIQSERFRDDYDKGLFLESQSRIRAMAQVHEQLYRSRDFSSIPAREYIEDLIGELCSVYGSNRGAASCDAHYSVETDGCALELELAVPIGLLVNELTTNSFKYAFADGRAGSILVSLSKAADGSMELAVRDDGGGFPPGFDPLTAGGMGYTIVQALATQLGATLAAANHPSGGAAVSLHIPPKRD